MNFTNLLYLGLWLFCYYMALLIIPYATGLLQAITILAPFWATIPAETHWLIGILMYIVVPLVAIAYTIKSSSPEQQIMVGQ